MIMMRLQADNDSIMRLTRVVYATIEGRGGCE